MTLNLVVLLWRASSSEILLPLAPLVWIKGLPLRLVNYVSLCFLGLVHPRKEGLWEPVGSDPDQVPYIFAMTPLTEHLFLYPQGAYTPHRCSQGKWVPFEGVRIAITEEVPALKGLSSMLHQRVSLPNFPLCVHCHCHLHYFWRDVKSHESVPLHHQ